MKNYQSDFQPLFYLALTLLLAGISQLLTVVVADKINQRQHIRSLKSFIA